MLCSTAHARRRASWGRTLTALIQEGLQIVLARSKPGRRRPRVELPVFGPSGGVMPGVDLNSSASLLHAHEEGLPFEMRR